VNSTLQPDPATASPVDAPSAGALKTLQVSESRYRRLFETARDGILILNAYTAQIDDVNPYLIELLGYSHAEFLGKKLWEVGPFADIAESKEMFAELQATGYIRYEDLPLKTKAGAKIDVEFVSNAYDCDGIRVIQCNIRNITQRKRVDAELRTLSRAVEQSPVSIVVTDKAGNIEYVNPRFEEVTGYTRAEVAGRNPRILKSGTTPAQTYRDVWKAIAAGGEWRGELCNRRKNGELFWEFATISGLRDERGQIGQYVGVKDDITERKAAASARHRVEEQLRESQKMEALGTLAGGVAHDFNNALAVIIGNAELARQDVGPAHPALESLEEINKASRRAKNLVQQILAFGRRQALELKSISLAPAVEEAARMLRATLPSSVNLSVACSPDAPVVLADAMQVEQMLLNLVNNAWQAPEGKVRPKAIEIRLSAYLHTGQAVLDPQVRFAGKVLLPGLYARLGVRDNAEGMTPKTISHLFEPFFTTKRVGEGTGLGLSVVFGIAGKHGAGIAVGSVPGEGSTFDFYFPAEGVQIPAVTQPDASAPVAGGASASGVQGKHILYIDDDDGVLRVMTQLLERAGFRVSAYSDGHKALEAARADPGQYDLAVTDYSMPRISGLEIATALLQLRADLPVAILTGYATEALTEEATAIGVREVISKPSSFDELMESIARLVQAR
jgi:two-component system cell cycle sensor histidine kinase/response regulator CckA